MDSALCVPRKSAAPQQSLKASFSLCLRLARSLTCWVNEPRGRPRASFLFLTDNMQKPTKLNSKDDYRNLKTR